jgi:hypothetical protein
MKAIDKEALNKWDELRKSIMQSTPVDATETYQQQQKRIADLESDEQAWKEYYFPDYFKSPTPYFHRKATRRMLRSFAENKHWYEVRHWARGLSKSTLTMMDVLFLVLTGKLRNIVLTSSTYDAAETFLSKYMVQLDANQRIIHDYGQQARPGMWTMGNFTTLKGTKFMALGAGQSPRGTSNEEIRPDCIIVDDFDTDQECLNPDIIDKKWNWFERALMFTVDVSEPYLVIWLGNIIAEDCCVVRAGKIADYTETINIRDESGVSVWLEKNSEEDIDYLLSKVSYEAGQSEYFNNPMKPGKAFPEMTYGKVPALNEMPFVVIYADPGTSNKDKPSAKSKAQNSCKAVVVVGHRGMYRYVLKAFVDHVNNSTFIDWIFAAAEYAKGAKAAYRYIENNSLQDPFYQQVIKPLIYAKNKAKNTSLHLTPDARKKDDKYTRIEAKLEPINRNGYLILNLAEKENPHMKRVEAQFKAASPNSKTMDAPDAVEGAVFIIDEKVKVVNPNDFQMVGKKKSSKRF